MPIQGFVNFYQENIGNGLPNIFRDAHIVGNKEQLSQFNQLWGSAAKQWQSGNFEGARDAFSQAQDFAIKITGETYKAMGTTDPGEPIRKLNDLFTGLSAAAQGAATGAAGYDKQGKPVEAAKKESYYVQNRPLSEGQVYLVFDRVVKLNEGPIWDKVKGAAGKAVGAVAQKAGQIGTNLTTKITADKLNSAWKKAGSPMDSEEVAKVLTAAGVGDDVVKQVYTDLKISAAPAAQAATGGYAEVKKAIAQLNTKDRTRMIAYLTKQLGTA
jgi:hypothetical protein